MTAHRRYTFATESPVSDLTWDRAGLALEFLCTKYDWYRDGQIEGHPETRLAFSVVVDGRDQWWCHRRALTLAETVFAHIGVGPAGIPTPVWEALPPHTNRGYNRTR